MMHIIFASSNPSKLEQCRGVFKDSGFTVLSPSEAGIIGEALEDGQTLYENAIKKARHAFAQTDGRTFVLAEDTGLFIKALGGAPGIHAARWVGAAATTEEIMQHTLRALSGIADRSAYFETVCVLITPSGQERFFSGRAMGSILESPRADFQPKMPYSGIFLSHETGKVWAEMTVDEENAVSHRGKALREARIYLEGSQD